MHNLQTAHGDLKGVRVLSDQVFTPLLLTHKGERPHQRAPTSLHRRLRPHNCNRRCDSCDCWDIPGVVDLKRHTDVIYCRGDLPVDEPRTVGSGKVRGARIRGQSTNDAIRLLRSRDGYLRGGCSREPIRGFGRFTNNAVGLMRTPPLR